MYTSQKMQRGASAIVVIIILAIIGAGAYIGLQYIPQYIEAGTVDSILSNIEKAHKKSPVSNVDAIRKMIGNQLNMNQLDDLKDSFKIKQEGDTYIITVG